MKILMTLMGLDIGGAETHVMELARELTRRGHRVILASSGGAFVPVLEESGVTFVEIPMNRRDPRQMLCSLRALEKLIRQEKPDLVHAHARIPAFLCGLLHKKLGFPFITSAHWVFAVTPLLRRMTDWGQRTVAVSEDIKTYLMTEYQVPEDQIHVTINGIDTDTFRAVSPDGELKQALHLGPGPVVCLVSRLDGDRYLAAEKLIAIAPELKDRIPGAQVLIVGGGDQEDRLRELAAAVNARAGDHTVVMTGARTDVARLVALGDVFVGVSRAALEAMAAEKPVILAGSEGYMGLFRRERLEEAMASNFCCRGGYPQVTEDALLADLTALLSLSKESQAELGTQGRQVVLDHYSVRRMTDDYEAAYAALLHPVKPVKAVISGYYGYGNLGDDAILGAIAHILSTCEPPIRLTVLSRDPKATARQFGLPAAARFSPVGVLGALLKSDILISGGGSLLQDRTSARSLRYYLAVIRLAELLRKPVFLYANGIGPVNRESGRRAVRRAVERCGAVTLRDADSLRELQSMGVTRQDMAVTADPTFSLKPDGQGQARLSAQNIPTDRPLLGFSLRQAPGVEGSLDAFAALADRISRELGMGVVFLVMQEPGDRNVSRKVADRMQEPAWILDYPETPAAMLGIIDRLSLVVSMRLHTIIFSASRRVPVVGCVYDPKVEAFLKLLDMPSCGTPESLDPEAAFRAVRDLRQIGDAAVRALDRRVTDMESSLNDTPALLKKLLVEKGIVEN